MLERFCFAKITKQKRVTKKIKGLNDFRNSFPLF
tara:strand:- start:1543 stop:1644 length:102 start_codon:yes stop_codon:yes gene_type:complete